MYLIRILIIVQIKDYRMQPFFYEQGTPIVGKKKRWRDEAGLNTSMV